MMRCFSTCFRRNKKKVVPDVYVLLLEGDKYYVGESIDVNNRIKSHRRGNGYAWTKKHKVVSVLEPFLKNRVIFGN